MIKKELLVSVIICNYNYGEFIQESIDSVLNQTYQNFEIIIIDDGSTDNSKELISKYKTNKKIISKFTDNHGQTAAMNLAVSMSSGELLVFLDSDDIFVNNKLEKLVDIYTSGYNYIYHDIEYFKSDTKLMIDSINKYLYNGHYQFLVYYLNKYIGDMTSTLAISKELSNDIFPLQNESKWKISTDALIVFSATLLSDVYYIDEKLTLYRVHENQQFFNRTISQLNYHKRLINIHKQKDITVQKSNLSKRYFENSYNLSSEFKTHHYYDFELLKLYLLVLYREMNIPFLNKIKTTYELISYYVRNKSE